MRRSFQKFLVVSLVIHLLFLWLLQWRLAKPEEKKDEAVELTLLNPELPHQIADIEEPPVQEKPKKPNFLGIYDSRVEEETVATTRPPAAPQKGGTKSQKETKEKLHKSEELGPKLAQRPPEEAKEAETTSGAEEGESWNQAYPEDYFPDYKVGPHTYLNVLRFPKIGYFVRLKKIFRTTFDPVPVLRQQAYQISKGQVEVVLGVTVASDGRLDNLVLISSSGLPLYDEEALRTIRDSAPFAAPPKELLDGSGKLRMSWTFIVYL